MKTKNIENGNSLTSGILISARGDFFVVTNVDTGFSMEVSRYAFVADPYKYSNTIVSFLVKMTDVESVENVYIDALGNMLLDAVTEANCRLF